MRSTQQVSWGTCSTSYASPVPVRSRQARPRLARPCRAGTAEPAEASLELGPKPLVVKSIPQARTPAAPPEAVPIEHSSAFLLRSRRGPEGEEEAERRPARKQTAEPFSGNAVIWALKKADESLDEIEENPPPVVQAVYEVSRGPVGAAASEAVTTVAKVTWQVGTEAVKAAAPVGKWALKQGFKLAVTAVSKGLEASISSGGSKDKKKK